jgi:hypothetical protein
VVIATDFASQSFDTIDAKHRLVEVHAATLPAVGARVKFARSSLANGTESASRTVTIKGTRPSTVIADGVVSFVNPANASYVLSARGVSLAIDTAPTPAPTTPPPATPPATITPSATITPPATVTPPATLPSVGQRLQVIVSLPPAGATGAAAALKEVSHTVLAQPSTPAGQPSGPLDLAGVITAIDKQKRIATISADGPGLGSDTIPLSVPPSISLRGLRTPATVVAQVSIAAGLYTLSWLAPDDSATTAANRTRFLGALRASAHSSRARKRSPSLPGRARAQGSGA